MTDKKQEANNQRKYEAVDELSELAKRLNKAHTIAATIHMLAYSAVYSPEIPGTDSKAYCMNWGMTAKQVEDIERDLEKARKVLHAVSNKMRKIQNFEDGGSHD